MEPIKSILHRIDAGDYDASRFSIENHDDGVNDMSLMDLLGMVCNWISVSDETGTNVLDLIEGKAVSGAISIELAGILENTVTEMGRL